ncbi:MAG: hypothetical protein R2708_25900 [Vicinamibacterales bacterium]
MSHPSQPKKARSSETGDSKPKTQPSAQNTRPVVDLPWTFDVVAVFAMAATVAATVFTGCQFFLTRQQFMADQRAWVHVAQGAQVFASSADDVIELAGVPIPLTNSGKTPATNIRVHSSVEFVQRAKSPSLAFNHVHAITTNAIVFPGSTFNAVAGRLNGDNSGVALTQEQREALKQGQAYLVVFAEINAMTASVHWTRWCSWQGYLPQTIPPPA